jgi:predicted RecA/RadA family phage recombinase
VHQLVQVLPPQRRPRREERLAVESLRSNDARRLASTRKGSAVPNPNSHVLQQRWPQCATLSRGFSTFGFGFRGEPTAAPSVAPTVAPTDARSGERVVVRGELAAVGLSACGSRGELAASGTFRLTQRQRRSVRAERNRSAHSTIVLADLDLRTIETNQSVCRGHAAAVIL